VRRKKRRLGLDSLLQELARAHVYDRGKFRVDLGEVRVNPMDTDTDIYVYR